MKATFLQILAVLFLASATTQAQMTDVTISASRKKLDEQKSRVPGETLTHTEIAYMVTVTNKTFRTLPEVEVKYMLFYEDVQPGSTDKPSTRRIKGKESLANLESNRPVTFETQPVKLSKSELDGNVYWGSGAKSRSKDSVAGIWFRAYAGGKLIGEYANPSTVTKKFDWKE